MRELHDLKKICDVIIDFFIADHLKLKRKQRCRKCIYKA